MRRLLLSICAVVMSTLVMAQPQMPQREGEARGMGGRHNRTSQKMEMLSRQLGLTEKQKEDFTPVYKDYTREISAVNNDMRAIIKSYDGQEMTDKVAMKIALAQLQCEANVVSIKKAYIKLFKSYLTPEQLAKFFMVEKRVQTAAAAMIHGHGPAVPPTHADSTDTLRPKLPPHETFRDGRIPPASENFKQQQ